MPTVLVTAGYRFYFYSSDGAEPAHIHVEHGERLAKYWLEPVELASSKRFRDHELNEVRRLVLAHREVLLEVWNEHFGVER